MAPKNTTQLLAKLRALMKNTAHVPRQIHAYIVPSGDAHQVSSSVVGTFIDRLIVLEPDSDITNE